MAKKPARPRRSVLRASSEDLPPNTVGGTLATRDVGGVEPYADQQKTKATERASLQEKRSDFLALARKRWRQSADSESELRRNMLDDLKFYNSEQWPDNIKMDRYLDGRPCLTINRLPQFVRQVLNQARQQRPAIQVNPIDNGADPDTAEVIQGITRSIERNSKAPIAYTNAGEHQVIMGRGWLRVRADWIASDSFEQEILIEAPEDPFTVYPDPSSSEVDGSDMGWAFLVARLPWHEYHVKYPDADRVSLSDWTSIGDDAPDWVTDSGVLVAEYYYIEAVADELIEFQIALPDMPQPMTLTTYRDMLPKEAQVLRRRPTTRRQLKWATINGIDVLEGNPEKTGGRNLPGPYIPLVPMIGERLMVNGRRNLRGMVRDAKDPQRTYNFWVSAETEMIALAPRAPVIGATGQFETTKEQWLLANRRNFPFLEYDPIDVNGNLVPAPQRNTYDANVQPIIAATQQADHDLKSVIGMFDASQERSREQSGKAIIARQQQGEQGNSHFLNNQAIAIEQVGRIVMHWIPVYYDRPQVVRIVGVDDRERDVMVHAGNPQAAQQMQQQQAQPGDPLSKAIASDALYDVGLGRYDVSVTVAPSYQSRRAESVDAMVQLLQAFPLAAPYALDVLVENMDWPGARQLSERFKHLVPPEARDDEGQQPLPPEVQQQIGQMKQQMEMMGQQLEQQQRIIDTKAQELAAQGQIKQLEIASQERQTQLRASLEMAKIAAQAQAEKELEILKGRLDSLTRRLELEHEDNRLLLAPPRAPTESLNYKDAPPDIRRQIEEQAGLQPSKQHDIEVQAMKEQAKPKPAPSGPSGPSGKSKPKPSNGGGG